MKEPAILESCESSGKYLATEQSPLVTHFELLATAPGGVARLRELILTLAVQGKLVPQEAIDEPASVLLKMIRAKKDRLVAHGKIKREKVPISPLVEDAPAELPIGWTQPRLGEIGTIGSSSRVHQKDWKTAGVPFYRAREIVKLSKSGYVDNELYISEELFSALSANGLTPQENDIMITGVGTIGVPYVVKNSDRFYFKDASVLIFKNYYGICANYLSWFFRSPLWIGQIHADSMGTTVDTLTIARASEVQVPLPPLAEQARIVARVEELMKLCDALEQRGRLVDEQHTRLTSTLFDALLVSESGHALAENWGRIAEHFDILLDRPESIGALGATIVQLAVRGQLAPQNPGDTPASELLARISEQRPLSTSGSRDWETESVSEGERRPLPSGWAWARLENISMAIVDCPHSTPTFVSNGLLCVDTNSFKGGRLLRHKLRYVNEQTFAERTVRLRPQPGDLVFAREGSVGESLIIPEGVVACLGQRVMLFRFSNQVFNEFVRMAITSTDFLDMLLELHKGIGAKHVNVSDMRSAVIPVPPLEEQRRIVARVEELRRLCADLRQHLTQARETQSRLADALVAEVA